MTRHATARSLAVLSFLAVLSCGCEFDYLLHLAAGELCSLSQTIPVEQALLDPRLTPEEQAKLALTQEVRQFGIDEIGLFAGPAYTVFEMNGNAPALYVLTASDKHRLRAYQWNIPFFGPSEVKGYFDRGMAEREEAALIGRGYDTYLGRADGFSTLGILPDPVRQSNLRLDNVDLAELILHEMTHSTVYKPSDVNFSESVATFVGRRSALAWFRHRFGAGSPEALAAEARYADEAVIDEYVVDLHDRLAAYYAAAAAAGQTVEEIVAGRQAEFAAASARFQTDYRPRLLDPDRWGFVAAMDLNNARLLTGIRYQGGLEDYQAVVDKLSGDLRQAVEVFQAAAQQADSREYLRAWVTDH